VGFDLEPLDFVVVNTKTGRAIAAFMLPTDAQRFAATKGEGYETVNADGTSLVGGV
jgi:hypothetical protein